MRIQTTMLAACAILGIATICESLRAVERPDATRQDLRFAVRVPVQGSWQPTVLKPNDLTDPPVNYPNSPGGACVGMSVVAHALWCSQVREGTLSLDEAALRMMHCVLPDRQNRLNNYPLLSHVQIDGQTFKLFDQRALTRVAEVVQRTLQPGGGVTQDAAEVQRIHAALMENPDRLTTEDAFRKHLEAAGGRSVVSLVDFSSDLKTQTGHCAIFRLAADGSIQIWDPNAQMSSTALGSGRTSPVELDVTEAGQIERLRYHITLPSGQTQSREFDFATPLASFIAKQ